MKGTIDGTPFDFDIESVRFDEAEAIERALGMSFTKWGDSLKDGSIVALRALVWIIRRRDEPGLRFDDPSLGSLPLSALVVDDEDEPDPTVPAPTGD